MEPAYNTSTATTIFFGELQQLSSRCSSSDRLLMVIIGYGAEGGEKKQSWNRRVQAWGAKLGGLLACISCNGITALFQRSGRTDPGRWGGGAVETISLPVQTSKITKFSHYGLQCWLSLQISIILKSSHLLWALRKPWLLLNGPD